jgi:hypothetical protein
VHSFAKMVKSQFRLNSIQQIPVAKVVYRSDLRRIMILYGDTSVIVFSQICLPGGPTAISRGGKGGKRGNVGGGGGQGSMNQGQVCSNPLIYNVVALLGK